MKRRGKSVAPQGKFAQIPVARSKDVLAEFSAPEFRVWFVLCLQNQHWANGTGKLCRSVVREFHLGSQRVVTAATKKLIELKFIIRTRAARQRVCALYGVTHLPLNTDALSKAGLAESQIHAALRQAGAIACDSNRGSANSDITREALNGTNDNRGSAKALDRPLVVPRRNRNSTFTPLPALPQGNTSKKSPCPIGLAGTAECGPKAVYDDQSNGL